MSTFVAPSRCVPTFPSRPLMNEMEPLNKLAIAGLGLMGGSLGLSCLERGLATQVSGFDSDPATVARALEIGAINHAASSLAEAVRGAGVVVIATPVGSIASVFAAAASSLTAGCIVTDLGSTKGAVVEQITPATPPGIYFIGGHPVAGSEKEGIEAATAHLFDGCLWVLTPTGSTPPEAYGRLMRFLSGLGVRILALDPRRHDEALALTSHLPQLLSSTLMGFADEVAKEGDGLPLLTAGGFRDMTRIAASSPDLWIDIVRENRSALLALVRKFQDSLGSAADALAEGDWESLRRTLEQARTARGALMAKPGVESAEIFELLVPVPDRPGVIAEISTTVNEAGVNIEDLNIVHSAEGGGVIHLQVSGEGSAICAGAVLRTKGYQVGIEPQG